MVIRILGFVATVDSTHLKFVQQADLKTQIEDLEYRNDTKMDLTNHNTQKQVSFQTPYNVSMSLPDIITPFDMLLYGIIYTSS